MKIVATIFMIIMIFGCASLVSLNESNHILNEINIPTAQCGMCAAKIDKTLNGVDGILKYKVELDNLKVKVKFDNEKISLKEIETLISNVGYQANGLQADSLAYNKLDMCCKLPKDPQ